MGNEHVRFLRNRLLNDRICCIQRQINLTDFFFTSSRLQPYIVKSQSSTLGICTLNHCHNVFTLHNTSVLS